MEEKEMNRKNKTVFIVIIIILVILLCVGAFFLGRWIANKEDNKETNNEVNNPTEVSDAIDSVIPLDENSEMLFYWFFEDIYNYYVSPSDNAEPIKINENFGFVKIENDKLMWNIDNTWVNDSFITDDVKLAFIDYYLYSDYYFAEYYDLIGIIVTNDNLVYKLTIDNIDLMYEEKYLDTIIRDTFDSIVYSEYENNINIDNIIPRTFAECSLWEEYYLMSGNDIYFLNDEDRTLIEYNPYNSTNNNLLLYANNCLQLDYDLTWDFDGYLEEIKDNYDNNIKATHIIKIKSNNEYYIFIVDENNNLYSIKEQDLENDIHLRPYKEIEEMSYNEDFVKGEFNIIEELNIDFIDGENFNITLMQIDICC